MSKHHVPVWFLSHSQAVGVRICRQDDRSVFLLCQEEGKFLHRNKQTRVIKPENQETLVRLGGLEPVTHQHRLSLLWVWAANSREVGVWILLLRDGDGGREAEGEEGLLHEDVSDAVERGVDKLQRATSVQIPER